MTWFKTMLRLCALICLVAVAVTVGAQETTVLRVGVPEIMGGVTDEVLQDFYDEHPNLEIRTVDLANDVLFFDPATQSPEEYIEGMQRLTEQADVVLINSFHLAAPVLSENFLLDIAPLVNADARFDDGTFHPMATQGFADDGHVWGLVNTVAVSAVTYNHEMFASQGMNPPTADWTIEDYRQAVQALQSDSLEFPIYISNVAEFSRALLDEPLYTDQSAQFAREDLSVLLTELSGLQGDSRENPAMVVSSITVVSQVDRLSAAPLPNNYVSRLLWGFGVSAGTEHPELAYELAVHLTDSLDVTRNTSGFSTRQDRLMSTLQAYDDAEQAIITQALSVPSAPVEDMAIRFLNSAISNGDVSIDVLQALETEFQTYVETFVALTDGLVITLDDLPAEPVIEDGVELVFGINSDLRDIDPQGWQDVIADFVADDPQVDAVTLIQPTYRGSISMASAETDCFYLEASQLRNESALQYFLTLSPLIEADASFDESRLIGGSLSAYEMNGEVWGLPIVIMPYLLQIDAEHFQTAGLPLPEFRWNILDLIPVLEQSQALELGENEPLALRDTDNLLSDPGVLMLIAAYGGLPIDYRTSPEAIDFTSPEVVSAIRTVLDLVEAGLLDYTPEGNTRYFDPTPDSTIIAQSLGLTVYTYDFEGDNPFVSFPEGQDAVPVSYRYGAGFISSTGRYPEACYRWLRHLSENSQMFLSVPAYTSADETSLYSQLANTYADLLDDPNIIFFPQSLLLRERFERQWLYEAFDAYLTGRVELEIVLQEAETKVMDLRECLDLEQPPATTSEAIMSVTQDQVRCAIAVDPSLAGLYGGLLDD